MQFHNAKRNDSDRMKSAFRRPAGDIEQQKQAYWELMKSK
jgi:hypothetical protein